MKAHKIAKLEELLLDYLGPNKTITDQESSRLTTAGENYGSLMLSLKVHTEDAEGKKETLEAVAKLPPPSDFIQKMFNTPITFRNEVNFYKVIVPALEDFVKDRNVDLELDCFPRFYGGRLNFSDEEVADEDAVLLLENLKDSGYTVVDRTVGFDFKAAKLILKALAAFHGVPLAMRRLDPEAFDKKIGPFLAPYEVFPLNEDIKNGFITKTMALIEELEDCKQYSSRAEDALKSSILMSVPKNFPDCAREPFATIIHADAWVNNFMVKLADDEATSCKIVDFQLYEYGSPARDVLFFISSSVQSPVFQEQFNCLIEFYHKNLIEVLEKFGCDTAPFSLDAFLKEVKQASKEYTFMQSVMMLEPIFATKDSVKELDEFTEEDMSAQREVSTKHKEKAAVIVKEYATRNLI